MTILTLGAQLYTETQKRSVLINNQTFFLLAQKRSVSRCNLLLKGKEQIQNNELRGKEKLEAEDVPSSKFKYVERGTQSRNGFRRNTETQTQGPARGLFSGTINRDGSDLFVFFYNFR